MNKLCRFVEKSYEKPILCLTVIAYTCFLYFLAFKRYEAFVLFESEDLGTMSSMFWNFSRGNFKEFFHYYQNLGLNHFSLVFFPLSFFQWIFPGAQAIFLYSSLTIAFALVPIFYIAKRQLKDPRLAWSLVAAYLFYAPKHSLALLDGDPLVLLMTLIPTAYLGILLNKPKFFFIPAWILLFCRTETGIVVIVLCFIAYQNKDFYHLHKKGIARLFKTTLILIPLTFFMTFQLTPGEFFYNSSYSGMDFYAKFNQLFSHVFNIDKFKTIFKVIYPTAGVNLIHPYTYLLSLTDISKIILADDLTYQRAHYFAGYFSSTFVILAVVLKSLRHRLSQNVISLIIFLITLICIASNFLPNTIGNLYPENQAEGKISDKRFINETNIFSKKFYEQDFLAQIRQEAIKLIDPSARIVTTGDMLAHLSSRKIIWQLFDQEINYDEIDMVLINTKHMYWGTGHYLWDESQLKKTIKELLDTQKWKLLYQNGSIYLFEKSDRFTVFQKKVPSI